MSVICKGYVPPVDFSKFQPSNSILVLKNFADDDIKAIESLRMKGFDIGKQLRPWTNEERYLLINGLNATHPSDIAVTNRLYYISHYVLSRRRTEAEVEKEMQRMLRLAIKDPTAYHCYMKNVNQAKTAEIKNRITEEMKKENERKAKHKRKQNDSNQPLLATVVNVIPALIPAHR